MTIEEIIKGESKNIEFKEMPPENTNNYTIEGKTVIVVTVLPEPQRPYYLKSKNKEKGTYIRVGGTTRLAHPLKSRSWE